jgi:2-polyprenyl-6-methoxyphenol hydroxylase-like FAD-dependent oxidoreductase
VCKRSSARLAPFVAIGAPVAALHAQEAAMLWTHEAEVLVVGAGPVGLMTALMLAERGVSVEVIDEEESSERRNYALTLHPSALQLLDDVGLATELLNQGLRVDRVAIRDDEKVRAHLRLDWLDAEFPYLLVLPRMALEVALERRLREKKVPIGWSQRLSDLAEGDDEVFCAVEKLGSDSGGYSVSDTMRVVERVRNLQPKFVVGADGFHSVVRRRLDIGLDRAGPPQGYAPTEFLSDVDLRGEMHVMFGARRAVMFPLPGGGCRFTTELVGDEIPPADSPLIPIGTRLHPRQPPEVFAKALKARVPWYASETTEVTWAAQVRFEPALVRRFGVGRTWLAGDAAHVTAPIGVHSMNEGLREAHDLGSRLARILKAEGPVSLLDRYDAERKATWKQLLGFVPALTATSAADPWIAAHASELLPCIPATGNELRQLARQLGLELSRTEA